jgi:hypothetical protein
MSAQRALAPLAPTHGQAFLSAQPLRLMAVDRDAVWLGQYMKTAISELAPLLRNLTELLAKILIIGTP